MENKQSTSTEVATQASIADRMVVNIKGADGNDVKITKKILNDTICRGMQISDADMVQFLTLCQVNQLNPFLREAYLVKYGSQPAQMITSKDAFMKRADRCQDFEGIESGVIGMNAQDVVQDFEGSFLPPKWRLIGGWAKVYRKGRKPYVQRVSIDEYNKQQSSWKQIPLTMIKKVAEVQALREAFPNNLSGLYISNEYADNQYEDVTDQVHQEIEQQANKQNIGFAADAPDAGAAPEHVDAETGEVLDAQPKANAGKADAKKPSASLFSEAPAY